MYDVDGNGVIDIQEMTKIVQVSQKKAFLFLIYEYNTHENINLSAKLFGVNI